MIPVKVEQVFLSNVGFVVILRSDRDPRSLPIFVGQAEAESIMLRINKVAVPRPLTHDLLKNLLDYLECRLARIEICDLKEGVFYGKLVLVVDGKEVEVDSRPSDAIALALRVDAPLLVAENVMDEAGRVLQIEDKTEEAKEAVQPAKPEHKPSRPKQVSYADTLASDLMKAVAEERYEDAARIRDMMQKKSDVEAHVRDALKKLKEPHAGN